MVKCNVLSTQFDECIQMYMYSSLDPTFISNFYTVYLLHFYSSEGRERSLGNPWAGEDSLLLCPMESPRALSFRALYSLCPVPVSLGKARPRGQEPQQPLTERGMMLQEKLQVQKFLSNLEFLVPPI